MGSKNKVTIKKKITRKNKLNRYKNNKKKRTKRNKRNKIRAGLADPTDLLVDLTEWLVELMIILKLGFLGLGIGLAIVSSCYILYSLADVAWIGGKQIKKITMKWIRWIQGYEYKERMDKISETILPEINRSEKKYKKTIVEEISEYHKEFSERENYLYTENSCKIKVGLKQLKKHGYTDEELKKKLNDKSFLEKADLSDYENLAKDWLLEKYKIDEINKGDYIDKLVNGWCPETEKEHEEFELMRKHDIMRISMNLTFNDTKEAISKAKEIGLNNKSIKAGSRRKQKSKNVIDGLFEKEMKKRKKRDKKRKKSIKSGGLFGFGSSNKKDEKSEVNIEDEKVDEEKSKEEKTKEENPEENTKDDSKKKVNKSTKEFNGGKKLVNASKSLMGSLKNLDNRDSSDGKRVARSAGILAFFAGIYAWIQGSSGVILDEGEHYSINKESTDMMTGGVFNTLFEMGKCLIPGLSCEEGGAADVEFAYSFKRYIASIFTDKTFGIFEMIKTAKHTIVDNFKDGTGFIYDIIMDNPEVSAVVGSLAVVGGTITSAKSILQKRKEILEGDDMIQKKEKIKELKTKIENDIYEKQDKNSTDKKYMIDIADNYLVQLNEFTEEQDDKFIEDFTKHIRDSFHIKIETALHLSDPGLDDETIKIKASNIFKNLSKKVNNYKELDEIYKEYVFKYNIGNMPSVIIKRGGDGKIKSGSRISNHSREVTKLLTLINKKSKKKYKKRKNKKTKKKSKN